ncbi:MAG: hypothetical protein ACRBDL_08920 [Alphaproteobacteria bacterium]
MDKDLSIIAAHVAHYLPGSWRLDRRPIDEDRRYLGVCILGDEHMCIRLQDAARMRKPGMIRISGEFPDFGLSYQERRSAGLPYQRTGINVSWTRKPQSIAADISRRLMPDYRQSLAQAKNAITIYKEKREVLNNIEYAFRKVMPDLSDYCDNRYSASRRYHFKTNGAKYRTGELEVSSYGALHCDLRLSDLPVDTAMRIMALLRDDG